MIFLYIYYFQKSSEITINNVGEIYTNRGNEKYINGRAN